MNRWFPAAVALLWASLAPAYGQTRREPVQWDFTLEQKSAPPGATVLGKVTARLEDGWHIYSLTNPEGGPTPTKVTLQPGPAIAGIELHQPPPKTKFDANFSMNVEAFERDLTVWVPVQVAKDAPAGQTEVALLVRYQACTDRECLPRKTTLTAQLMIDPAAPAATAAVPAGFERFTGPHASLAAAPPAAPPAGTGAESQNVAPFLALAFGFGLAAIFTPCVFPMIPITLSFFLNRPGVTRAASLRQAIVFCLGIVVLFTALGLIVTAALGPFGVVQLGSNPWVNGFIALVFIAFGLSLLGAFEISLPSGLLTRMNAASERGGILGTLLMGLTFSLTSFACVGPFVGTLLAGSVQGGAVRPALGMMAFAAGLASPFLLLAMFPSYLQRMPRSGGWLARVKVVMGFIILAAALKYLSSIDQTLQWNLLTRERFLAAWVVLFALPGLYLLGFLRLEGIRSDETLGVGRTLTGAVFLVFALSLIPGMFGGRLGELDAFVPLPSEGTYNAALGGAAGAGANTWIKNDLEAALQKAKAEGKQVLASFTGYACTNCHWMKANMFTRPEIALELTNFVLVELYTDGTDAESEENQKLQETRFGTVAIPYYVVFDASGNPVRTFGGLTRDTDEYRSFLRPASTEQIARAQ
jgi:thiol:disulfide interchange protein DsbD